MSEEWRIVRRVLRGADVVLEVLDIRDPLGTRSRRLEEMARRMGKPVIIVLNKSDLVPRSVAEEWVGYFRARGYRAVYISAAKRLGTRMLWRVIRRASSKDVVVVAVTGMPNVGKSTIINVLRGRHGVGTSPIPGFTRHATRLRAATWLRVIDTPGVVPRGDRDELALRGALRPEALDDPVVAASRLVEVVEEEMPGLLEGMYGVPEGDPYVFLEALARRRGLLGRGGVPRVDEAARLVLRDWQSGRMRFYRRPPSADQSSESGSR